MTATEKDFLELMDRSVEEMRANKQLKDKEFIVFYTKNISQKKEECMYFICDERPCTTPVKCLNVFKYIAWVNTLPRSEWKNHTLNARDIDENSIPENFMQPIVCECGGTKTNTTHSSWCPVK